MTKDLAHGARLTFCGVRLFLRTSRARLLNSCFTSLTPRLHRYFPVERHGGTGWVCVGGCEEPEVIFQYLYILARSEQMLFAFCSLLRCSPYSPMLRVGPNAEATKARELASLVRFGCPYKRSDLPWLTTVFPGSLARDGGFGCPLSNYAWGLVAPISGATLGSGR